MGQKRRDTPASYGAEEEGTPQNPMEQKRRGQPSILWSRRINWLMLRVTEECRWARQMEYIRFLNVLLEYGCKRVWKNFFLSLGILFSLETYWCMLNITIKCDLVPCIVYLGMALQPFRKFTGSKTPPKEIRKWFR